MKINKKKNAFTLVELIVVVSIILILSGILVPKVLGYQNKAKQAKAVNTARQLFECSMENLTESEGTFNQTNLLNALNSNTGLTLATGDVTVPDAQTATINFSSDSVNYKVSINGNDNSFTLNEGTSEIYKNK